MSTGSAKMTGGGAGGLAAYLMEETLVGYYAEQSGRGGQRIRSFGAKDAIFDAAQVHGRGVEAMGIDLSLGLSFKQFANLCESRHADTGKQLVAPGHRIAVRYSEHDDATGLSRDAGRQTLVASEYDLWWSAKAPANQPLLMPSYVRLTHEFFEEITSRPVPVNLDALKLLRGSPLRLDIYAWLTYRMAYLRRATKVPWDGLRFQFGTTHADTKQGRHNFRSDFEKHLRYVLAVYPDAQVSVDHTGLLLRPSKTHVDRGARSAIKPASPALPAATTSPVPSGTTPTCPHGGPVGTTSTGAPLCPLCRAKS